ncbi:MAG: hypothetical protein AB7D06_14965 [Pedobacter sp.]
MKPKILALVAFICLVSSCTSIEGTRNKSYTHRNSGSCDKMTKVAILPIEETSKFPLLPELLEQRINQELVSVYPGIQIIDPPEFGYELQQHNKLESFSSWYMSYKTTKYIDFNKLNEAVECLGTDYLLSIRSLDIDREKIHAVDAGYSGMVSDANNVYRTNLKFIGELIDIRQQKIVWQGIGYSENINSPRRPLDLFFIIKNQKNPEIESFLNELVSVAAKGFVSEMAKLKN